MMKDPGLLASLKYSVKVHFSRGNRLLNYAIFFADVSGGPSSTCCISLQNVLPSALKGATIPLMGSQIF